MSDRELLDEARLMRCTFCGYELMTTMSPHCGPHKLVDGTYYPAVRMVEVRESEAGSTTTESNNDR
jgi:hypothetical protein